MVKRTLLKLKDYIFSGSARLASVGSQFLLIAALGNTGSLDLIGFWGPFTAFILISVVVLNVGQAASAYIHVPPLVKSKNIEVARSVSGQILNKNLWWGLALTPVVSILAYINFHSIALTALVTMTALLLSLGETSAALLRSFNRIVLSEIVKNTAWRMFMLITIVLLARTAFNVDSIILAKLLAIAAFIQAITIILYFKPKLTPPSRHKSFAAGDNGIDIQNWMIQCLQSLNQNLDVILVALIFTPAQTAIYFLATRLTSIIALPLSVTNPVITPIFSLIAKNGVSQELSKRVTLNTGLNVLASLTIGGLLLFFADPVASFLVGEKISVKNVFIILAFGQVVNAVLGPTMQISQLFNFRKRTVVLQLISLVIVIVSAVTAYQLQTVLAFAYGITIGRILLHVGVAFFLARAENINILTGSPIRRSVV